MTVCSWATYSQVVPEINTVSFMKKYMLYFHLHSPVEILYLLQISELGLHSMD
jgi:hypothetical protein